MDNNQPEQRLYMRLSARLREEIVMGLLMPGAALPSIETLRQMHGLSRQTAGKALQILEREGAIYREPGLGYFVSGSEDPEVKNSSPQDRG